MGSRPSRRGQATKVEGRRAAGWSKSRGKLLGLPYSLSFVGVRALLTRELALMSPPQVASAWNSQEKMKRGRFEPYLVVTNSHHYLRALGCGGWEWLGFGTSAQKMLMVLKVPRRRAEPAGQARLRKGRAVPCDGGLVSMAQGAWPLGALTSPERGTALPGGAGDPWLAGHPGGTVNRAKAGSVPLPEPGAWLCLLSPRTQRALQMGRSNLRIAFPGALWSLISVSCRDLKA